LGEVEQGAAQVGREGGHSRGTTAINTKSMDAGYENRPRFDS